MESWYARPQPGSRSQGHPRQTLAPHDKSSISTGGSVGGGVHSRCGGGGGGGDGAHRP